MFNKAKGGRSPWNNRKRGIFRGKNYNAQKQTDSIMSTTAQVPTTQISSSPTSTVMNTPKRKYGKKKNGSTKEESSPQPEHQLQQESSTKTNQETDTTAATATATTMETNINHNNNTNSNNFPFYTPPSNSAFPFALPPAALLSSLSLAQFNQFPPVMPMESNASFRKSPSVSTAVLPTIPTTVPTGATSPSHSDTDIIDEFCVVCRCTKLNRNKVCYISEKNVQDYMKAFPEYTGTFGRCCHRCYSKFYVWKSQMKHGHKKCVCCQRDIVRQSCSFINHADIYQKLFPGVIGDVDSRVCQSCYYKGLKFRNGKKESNDTDEKKKKSRKKKREKAQNSSENADEEVTSTPKKRKTPKKKKDTEVKNEATESSTNASSDIDIILTIRLYNRSMMTGLPQPIPCPNAELTVQCVRRIKPNILMHDLLELVKSSVEAELKEKSSTTFILAGLQIFDKNISQNILCGIVPDDEFQFQKFPLPNKSVIYIDAYY
jgi:hypothetical protein